MSQNDVPLQSFIEKWQQRWPEWAIAEIFVEQQQRQTALAWFALLQELLDAALRGHEPAPGMAKLAWWQEELTGWSKNMRRHPLAAQLMARSTQWTKLAHALTYLRQREELTSAQSAIAIQAMQPFAEVVAAIESEMFEGTEARAQDLAGYLLAEQHLLNPDTISQQYIQQLNLPLPAFLPVRPRQLFAAIVYRRAQQYLANAKLEPLSHWTTLWLCWRSLRHASFQ